MNKMKTSYEIGGAILMNRDATRRPGTNGAPRPLRLAVVSDAAEPLPALDAFEVEVVPSEEMHYDMAAALADIVVLDTRGQDGLSMVAAAAGSGVPVVALGDMREPAEHLRYLDAGADEYLYTGAPPAEVAARLRSLARRHAPASDEGDDGSSDYHGAGVTISLDRHEVRREGRLVHMTPAEFRLLSVLARYADQVVPYYRLAGEVWGGDHADTRAHLRVHIRHLRQKLERDPEDPALILTERGRGYRLHASRVSSLRWAS